MLRKATRARKAVMLALMIDTEWTPIAICCYHEADNGAPGAHFDARYDGALPMTEDGWRDDDDIGMLDALMGSTFFIGLVFGSALIIL